VSQRTYWHLAQLGRRPNDYDIAATKLLYYQGRGFEVRTPVADWYRAYQTDGALACADWDTFRDPRETTYAKYTELQRTKEAFVDGVLAAADGTGGDALAPAWIATLAHILPPLRYPVHGLQMLASYVGTMAPGGRIAIACLFQAADEMRRTQRLAYRLRQLQHTAPAFGTDARAVWEGDPLWQPLREVIERLLVVRDWGEAFVGLCLALKPRVDGIVAQLAELARRSGDHVLGNLLFSLDEDCRWHREWSRSLAEVAVAARPENRAPMERWLATWDPLAARAAAAFAPVLGEAAIAAIEVVQRDHVRAALAPVGPGAAP
jgi:toluene monooxygenase system protein E